MINELEELKKLDIYPFHMPGHKRNMHGYPMAEAYDYDITEIDGFDNLHDTDSDGIIKEQEDRAAKYYGADEAHILINGSSCGILAAIGAVVPHHGKILMARNSHKSAYNALYINEMEAEYVMPETAGEYGMNGGVAPAEIAKALSCENDIKAVFITSPTYEGFISDIPAIAGIAHAHGIPLILDSAHGAHLPMEKSADIVIMSLHKTLPAFTSTALVLINGNLVDRYKLREYLTIFQTTSPSYILMAGVENCFDILANEGEKRFAALNGWIDELYKNTKKLKKLQLIGPEYEGKYGVKKFDRTKLIIADRTGKTTGREIYAALRTKYRIQPEMAAGRYCLCMSSIMDTEDGFIRLFNAMRDIDDNI